MTSLRWSSTPPFMSAPESTKIEARMMMISLEKPENASSTVRMPESTRTASRIRVAMSTEIHSNANTTMIATSRPRTRRMGNVMERRVCH